LRFARERHVLEQSRASMRRGRNQRPQTAQIRSVTETMRRRVRC